ncbi:MAG: PaaI family thioesterase [Paludibacteraceae bacterium]|nr:PaaI family thioesterase [Paludibacteraceae bacterium]
MDNTLKEKIFNLLGKDTAASNLNIKLVEIDNGTAIAKMEVDERHMNGLGTVQGGVLFTLADFACAAAANSQGKIAVSLNANINFVKAVNSGTLTATATEMYLRRTVGGYNVDVRDEEGELVANFQSTSYRKDPK